MTNNETQDDDLEGNAIFQTSTLVIQNSRASRASSPLAFTATEVPIGFAPAA